MNKLFLPLLLVIIPVFVGANIQLLNTTADTFTVGKTKQQLAPGQSINIALHHGANLLLTAPTQMQQIIQANVLDNDTTTIATLQLPANKIVWSTLQHGSNAGNWAIIKYSQGYFLQPIAADGTVRIQRANGTVTTLYTSGSAIGPGGGQEYQVDAFSYPGNSPCGTVCTDALGLFAVSDVNEVNNRGGGNWTCNCYFPSVTGNEPSFSLADY